MTKRRDTNQRDLALRLPLELPGAVLTNPFGDDVNVYKVGMTSAASPGAKRSPGKIFCLVSLSSEPGTVTLKVEPDRGAALVNAHEAMTPGYHMNKRHWITVTLDGSVPDHLVSTLVEDAYDLTVATLTAQARFAVDPDRFPLPPARPGGPRT